MNSFGLEKKGLIARTRPLQYQKIKERFFSSAQVFVFISFMATWTVPILINFNSVEIGAVQTTSLEKK